ncbi:10318_t:CDS:1, partial [Racocetra persica]
QKKLSIENTKQIFETKQVEIIEGIDDEIEGTLTLTIIDNQFM